ncbi:MAG: hypothetical protein R2822_05580 [Spirosomataceae bacterium]
MQQHDGVIQIGTIENSGTDDPQTGLLTAQFTHYSDCQQLAVWIPQYGRNGYSNYQIINTTAKYIVEEGLIEDKLNGSVQLLFDTLSWSEGAYVLEINRLNDSKHLLYFQKYPPDWQPEKISADTSEAVTNETLWKTYSDAWGNPLPNEDLALRKSVFKYLNMKARLEYEGNFRGGNVIYIEEEIRLSFWHEMGGGNCKMYIDIPAKATWERATHTPLGRRDEIIHFIAETVRREKAPSWRYEIGEQEIAFY